MATILGIKKAKQVIKLDDSDDSPEFILDLTSKNIDKATSQLKRKFSKYLKQYEELAANGGEATDDELKQLASFWKETICTLLGNDAYPVIVDYVSDGEALPVEDLVIVMAPIVIYLIEQVTAVATVNGNKMYAKYLSQGNAANVI